MHRGKEIIYIAHCVLNQNSVIREWERAKAAFIDIVRVILECDISMIQLPCPEFSYLGESRSPKTKEEYDVPEYRKICKELAERVIVQMKEYLANDYKIKGLIGIAGSPSCDVLGKKGIFMEELFNLMDKEKIKLEVFEIPEEYVEGKDNETVIRFKRFIEKQTDKNIK